MKDDFFAVVGDDEVLGATRTQEAQPGRGVAGMLNDLPGKEPAQPARAQDFCALARREPIEECDFHLGLCD